MASPQNGVPGMVYFAYLRLEAWSIAARYRGQPFSRRMVDQALNRYLPVVTAFAGL